MSPRPLLTTIGEILVDFTPIVEAGRTVGFQMHPGGSPYNVAVGLTRLGAHVEFAGKASTDFFGRFLVDHLERQGVGTRFLSRSPAPSTLGFVTLEAGEPSFAFYGEGAADSLLRPDDLPPAIASTQVLHFGSISLLREPTSRTVVGLVERLAGRAMISFDPNIRPRLVQDPEGYRRLLERLVRASDIVKTSAADLRWLAPGRDVEAASAALLALGPALVVVTLGGEGCYAVTGRTALWVRAPAVQVMDTVGAGDAFSAALLADFAEHGALSRSDLEALDRAALEKSLRFATTGASLSCTRAGADPPRREEIAAALSETRR